MPPLIPQVGTPLVGPEEPFKIPNGQSVSNAIKAKGGNNASLMVYARNATDGAITYNYQVTDNVGVGNWYDLVDAAAANIIPPLTGKAKALNEPAAAYRIKASAPVTADRFWDVTAEL